MTDKARIDDIFFKSRDVFRELTIPEPTMPAMFHTLFIDFPSAAAELASVINASTHALELPETTRLQDYFLSDRFQYAVALGVKENFRGKMNTGMMIGRNFEIKRAYAEIISRFGTDCLGFEKGLLHTTDYQIIFLSIEEFLPDTQNDIHRFSITFDRAKVGSDPLPETRTAHITVIELARIVSNGICSLPELMPWVQFFLPQSQSEFEVVSQSTQTFRTLTEHLKSYSCYLKQE